MGALTPPWRNLAGYAKRRKPFAGADARNGQHNGLCRNISFYPKTIPHNSKCRYGERGAAAAKPKAQIILDAAKVSAASGGNSEPKQGQRSQSARGFCPRSTMRVPQPDIIEHFGNADAVPQLPERCLSRKAGIVRCCHCFGEVSFVSAMDRAVGAGRAGAQCAPLRSLLSKTSNKKYPIYCSDCPKPSAFYPFATCLASI